MNKDNARDYLPLVQALVDGKVIEVEEFPGRWVITTEVTFDAKAKHYRIKPEPREVWVNRRNDGLNGNTAFDSEAKATDGLMSNRKAIRYREVLE